MPFAKLRDFLEAVWQLRKLAAPPQTLDRAELIVRGPAGADEVGVVGVGQPVRAGSGCGHHRPLFEEKYRLARTGECEHVRNRLHSLRVSDGVTATVEDAETRTLLVGDPREECRAVRARAPDLEVRRAWAAERPASE
jgi:hypothetical protein